MKSRFILVFAILTTSFLLLACTPASGRLYVEISRDEFYENHHARNEVQVSVGDTMTVDLCSNATTSFQWEEAQISDQAVLKQVDHKYEPAESENIVGGAGKEVWTFQALKPGTGTVSLEYSRPWDGGEKGEWTYSLRVGTAPLRLDR